MRRRHQIYDSPADAREKLAAFRERYKRIRPPLSLCPALAPRDHKVHRLNIGVCHQMHSSLTSAIQLRKIGRVTLCGLTQNRVELVQWNWEAKTPGVQSTLCLPLLLQTQW